MEPVVVALFALTLIATGFAVWLLYERRRLAIELSREVGEREAARTAKAELAAELAEADAAIERLREAVAQGEVRAARLEAQVREVSAVHAAERRSLEREHAEKERLLRERLDQLDQRSREAFESAAARTLRDAGAEFLKRAEQSFRAHHERAAADADRKREAIDTLVRPIGETLERTQQRLAQLDERVRQSAEAGEQLRAETGRLVRALGRPEVRGRYGELQLRRIAELAGMSSLCDFDEQRTEARADGSRIRPDMVVRLPNQRVIAIDAKCNLDAYLDAHRAETDEARDQALDRFSTHMADQVRKLSDRAYWQSIEGSVDFVVMFVPGDHFLDAAMARRPDLLERAAAANVILASPATLIGLLRAVAVGWREHHLAEEGRALLKLGQELHERAARVYDHVATMGQSLDAAVRAYNSVVGSIERRLTPTLRRFEQHGVRSGRELPDPPEITIAVRGQDAANPRLFADPGATESPTK